MDKRTWGFLLAGLIVTLIVAGVVSGFASSEPDGLEKVAADQGFDANAQEHSLDDAPLADYEIEGIDNDRLSTGIAGLIGVAATLATTLGLLYGVRRLRRSSPDSG